ncbi:Protein bicaudal C [Frankliniella fusca]|uniref:Protein bicaudal C n=1 Tax=Frankliniella fusca TaxID=407009 RepID=A0AAE1HH48_9NEOP|nr:Protein bicaudal C [Frankliniella fusca]
MLGYELMPEMAGLSPGMASDAVSEVSTRGSSMCSGSGEDLRDFAAHMGLQEDELCQDRFRVDRRKLEHMLLGDTPTKETAADFFQRTMDETNTLIIWPARLKIGSKSKNDPHVRIAGRPDDVKEAKAKVMSALDARTNRVTMKLNVSYTDHSHIIGRGGLTIKKVMEDTGCHIHFPDSNRSNPTEKSNQVSIAGDLAGVERARACVRELTPLMFSFELPIVGSLQPYPDPESPFMRSVQEKYNVQVMFRTRPKLHATLVVVKGCEWEVAQVKEATLILINYMCDSLANQVQVQMSMEISPQHHPTVVGKNNSNLKMIMHRTATQIMFPDSCDPNIPSIKKSNVLITGVIHNVYIARQQLLGSLPLVLMFDVPEESISVQNDQVTQIMQTYDVLITIRHKPKQSSMSITVKGIERNATKIYEARKQLLNLKEETVKADIPLSYQLMESPSLYDHNANAVKASSSPFSLLSINTANKNVFAMPSPTSLSPGISPSLMSSSPSVSPLTSLGLQWNNFNLLPATHEHSSQALTQHQFSQLMRSTMSQTHQYQHHLPLHHHHHHHQQQQQQQELLLQQLLPRMEHTSLSGPLSDGGCSGSCSSLGYHSRPSSSQSLDYQVHSSMSSSASPSASPRVSSPLHSFNDSSKDLRSSISESSESSYKSSDHQKLLNSALEYQRKKALAAKGKSISAMQMKPAPEILRVPSSTWSGYGFSQSSPSNALKEQLKKERIIPEPLNSDCWKNPSQENLGSPPSSSFPCVSDLGVTPGPSSSTKGRDSPFSSSSYLDSVPSSSRASISSMKSTDLTSLLISIGMEKYINVFKEHEIDLNVFMTLTDKDLRDVGVTTFGARRTMLMAISQHKGQGSPFRYSAAPGAERKGSSSTTGTNSPSDIW